MKKKARYDKRCTYHVMHLSIKDRLNVFKSIDLLLLNSNYALSFIAMYKGHIN
jgi:hypothetical protein